MEEKKNKFMSVVYQLYSLTDGEKNLEEQTGDERPFEFITGFSIALDAFEQQVMKLEKGSKACNTQDARFPTSTIRRSARHGSWLP